MNWLDYIQHEPFAFLLGACICAALAISSYIWLATRDMHRHLDDHGMPYGDVPNMPSADEITRAAKFHASTLGRN